MSSLSLLFDNNIDLSSLNEIPDTHCWTAEKDHHIFDPSNTTHTLSVIDLADPNAAQRASDALESFGAFQLVGHNIPTSVFDGLEAQARRLFTLPTHQKLRAARSPGSISGYGMVPISSFFSKLMWSEGFTVSGSPRPHAVALWPDNPTPLCEAIEDYIKQMKSLGQNVGRLILKALQLKEQNDKGITDEMEGVLQLNWYPTCPDPARTIGLAAHTDSALFTILHQTKGSKGLQILWPEKTFSARWVSISPVMGSLIVIAGDLLHVFSNGRVKSPAHRVMVNKHKARFSAAYFCGPGRELSVRPDPRLVDPNRGPLFRSVTWSEYREIKGKLFQGAIDEISLPPRVTMTKIET